MILVIATHYRTLPESLTWLVANNRIEEAEQILRKAARVNGVEFPEVIFSRDTGQQITREQLDDGSPLEEVREQHNHYSATIDTERIIDPPRERVPLAKKIKNHICCKQQKSTNEYNVWDIYKSSILRRHSLILLCLW